MTRAQENRFWSLLGGLDRDPRTLRMRQYLQHGSITTYDHCLRVARLSYAIGTYVPLALEERSLVRAAFLHDYFLYDWHTKGDHLHGFHHPKIAADNAARDFGLSQKETDIIQSHMWPLTLFSVPDSKEGWIVSLSDKICSLQETVLLRRRKETALGNHLVQ